jgi:MSHA biogenesis protein MshJ
MKQLWEKISLKVDAMSKRERVMVFAALAVLVIALINALLLEPIFARYKLMTGQLVQQQEKIAAVQLQIAAAQQENTPQRIQLNRIRQDLAEGDAYLQSSRDRLVLPERMADHLRQLLNRNIRLQLVGLQTLPATPLLEQPTEKSAEQGKVAPSGVQDKQVFKHGVQLTLRGNYLDLLQYVSALEKLPQQMFWARAQMNVAKYPTAELTLTLYTLSLDRTWLKV